MKHTECKDCELSNGDCGYHFKMDGTINYDIASLSACDQYGNCEFFKPKAKPKSDLISREALKEDFKSRLTLCNKWIEEAKDKETKIRASAVKAFIGEVIMTINNAPTVSDRYEEGYAQGYIDGSTGADWKGGVE